MVNVSKFDLDLILTYYGHEYMGASRYLLFCSIKSILRSNAHSQQHEEHFLDFSILQYSALTKMARMISVNSLWDTSGILGLVSYSTW